MAVLKLLYGALFVIVLPALLVLWARAAAHAVTLPVPLPAAAGFAATGAGLAMVVSGMAALWRYGRGLPMNAFPPPRYVTRGIYRWLAHPVYTGFVLMVAGVAIAARSASGLYLVAPAAALGSMALVLGYERIDLRARFGEEVPTRAFSVPFWPPLQRAAELVANSWREWRFGPVRIINHGVYAGAATFIGVAGAGLLAGPGHAAAVAGVALVSLVAAGLWAQFVEGSPRLLRPFGYYGGVMGVALGVVFAPDPWLLAAAYSAAGPWVQATGRLRCLVQGCCHGRPAPKHLGIRYRHPQSRVCRLTGWRGIPLHATPLYSILWNIVVGIGLAVLWSVGTALSLVAGVYLLLGGLGRFVEEAYRGEPQTRVMAGLRLYQWLAIGCVVVGAVLTSIPTAPAPAPQWAGVPLGSAAALGALAWFLMGVDFPDSNRRFARLA